MIRQRELYAMMLRIRGEKSACSYLRHAYGAIGRAYDAIFIICYGFTYFLIMLLIFADCHI